MNTFFVNPDNIKIIKSFLAKIESIELTDTLSDLNPIAYLNLFFSVALNNKEKFDEYCTTNIQSFGRSMMEKLIAFDVKSETARQELLVIFVHVYRFLLELEFTQSGELSFELQSMKNWVNENLDKFLEPSRNQLVWAHYLMPAVIAKQLIHDPNVDSFRQFNLTITKAEKLKNEWDEEIKGKQALVENLKKNLDRYETSYNFVGLVDAFRQLLKTKEKEKLIAFLSLVALGGLILIPLASEIWYVLLSQAERLDFIKQNAILVLPATLGLELFLFYFFRVVLLHFRTVKAHILQLELRGALCQFIQSYTTYASSAKKNDSTALDRFESLVFSGIISSEEKLPSTFDGAEHLAKLINSFRTS